MSSKENEVAKSLTKAVSALPEEKLDYIFGYAEGVLAMADRARRNDQQPADRPSA